MELHHDELVNNRNMNSTCGKNLASASASDIRLSFCDSVFSLCSNFGICGRKTGVGNGKGLLAATRMQCLCLSIFWWGCFPFKGVHIWLMKNKTWKCISIIKKVAGISIAQTILCMIYQIYISSLITSYDTKHIEFSIHQSSAHPPDLYVTSAD